MKIAKELLISWKKLYDHGDIQLIHEESGISRNTISNALDKGRASEPTLTAINKYYVKKKQSSELSPEEKELSEKFSKRLNA